MNVKEANRGLLDLMMYHVLMVQTGKWGEPDLEDLQFCGQLHTVLEKNGLKMVVSHEQSSG